MTAPVRGGVIEDAKPGDDDLQVYSVTTIIGAASDKSNALIPWAIGETAAKAVDRIEVIRRRIAQEGPESAIDYIERLRFDTNGLLSDAQRGTVAHELFNEMALTGNRPRVTPDLHPLYKAKGKTLLDADVRTITLQLDQFERFLHEFQPEYHACETVVFTDEPNLQYAGQADAFVTIEGVPLVLDYKTSAKTWTKGNKLRGPYAEVGLQLAAYRYARKAVVQRARRYTYQSRRYYLLSPIEREAAMPVPEVDGGVAVYVTPERYGVYPVRCGPEVFDAFLAAMDVARFHLNIAKHIVGNPMMPPHPIAPDTSDPFAGLPV